MAYHGSCLFIVPCLCDARRKEQRKKERGTEAREVRGRKGGREGGREKVSFKTSGLQCGLLRMIAPFSPRL